MSHWTNIFALFRLHFFISCSLLYGHNFRTKHGKGFIAHMGIKIEMKNVYTGQVELIAMKLALFSQNPCQIILNNA